AKLQEPDQQMWGFALQPFHLCHAALLLIPRQPCRRTADPLRGLLATRLIAGRRQPLQLDPEGGWLWVGRGPTPAAILRPGPDPGAFGARWLSAHLSPSARERIPETEARIKEIREKR